MQPKSKEYEMAFKLYMIQVSDCGVEAAQHEYDAHIENIGEQAAEEFDADPYLDADECMSYWSE